MAEIKKNIYEIQQFFINFTYSHYPWRFVDEPYCVLVSEFLLHRTQTNQVIPVYKKVIAECPTLLSFVQKTDEEIFQLTKSLGLKWRIKNMISALKEIEENHKKVPVDYEKLLSIKGIGPYIAGAVVCFSADVPVALIDTNTVRVLGRLFGLRLEGEARRRKDVISTIEICTPDDNPRHYYYSIIDFAHEICKPNNPLCGECKLCSLCEFNKNR
ncbi:MAG: hypothetical protein K8R40_05425 [Anaerolineaceae bacterium]|nr:hypothetical protein [Anaerolineaceae bacterium]